MYAEQALIDRIHSQTGYTTGYADEVNIDISNYVDGTKVWVGHAGIKMQYPDNFWRNGYEEFENQQVLITHISFICARTDWVTVRSNIYAAYSTFSPVSNPDYSRLAFISSEVVAKGNNNILTVETIGLIFPSIA